MVPATHMNGIDRHFQIQGEFVTAVPWGNGHINDSYRASCRRNGSVTHYLHQRINQSVFPDPEGMMENIARVTAHLRRAMDTAATPQLERRVLQLIPAQDGRAFHVDEQGEYWRVYVFIEGATSHNEVTSVDQAYQAARAFGGFQAALQDLDPACLTETIPGFHDTPRRFQAFQDAVSADSCRRVASARPEIAFVEHRMDDMSRLADLAAAGKIPVRIAHNDTKLNNVLFDDATGEGICVIDLDTVMPGLAVHDFGDMVRTATSPAPEDERDLSRVVMRMEMFQALVRGYLETAGSLLNDAERSLLPFSGKLLALECGMRFLTDHLQGDTYFKVHREAHNLDRCRTQFRLVESIEAQEDSMQELVASY